MSAVLAALLFFATAPGTAPASAKARQADVERLLAEANAGRLANIYPEFSTSFRKRIGPAQLAGYLASRRTVFGNLVLIRNWRETKRDGNRVEYSGDLAFERGGVAPSVFSFVQEDGAVRFDSITITTPNGVNAPMDDAHVLPVLRELVEATRAEGLVATIDRLSFASSTDAEKDRQATRAVAQRLAGVLGRLESYEMGRPTWASKTCREVPVAAKFEHGNAELLARLCWDDGYWFAQNANWKAEVTPLLVERALATVLAGGASIQCPRGDFPVDAEITCRVTVANAPAQKVRVRRTSETDMAVIRVE